MEEFGGRVLYASSVDERRVSPICGILGTMAKPRYIYDTCVLVDLSQWKDEMSICVKSRFPDAEIRVVHSSSSLTGFCVVMKLPTSSYLSCQVSSAASSAGGDYELVDAMDAQDCHAQEQHMSGQEVTGGAASGLSSSNPRGKHHSNAKGMSMIQRCSNCAAKACKEVFRTALIVPVRLYIKMERQKSHMTGMLVTAGLLYGTYFAIRAIMASRSSPSQYQNAGQTSSASQA